MTTRTRKRLYGALHLKHTPGPWQVEVGDDGRPRRIVANGEHVTHVDASRYVDESTPDAEAAANAALIAASPELLELAKRSLVHIHQCNGVFIPSNDEALKIGAELCRQLTAVIDAAQLKGETDNA